MTREEAIQIIKNLPIYRMEQEYDRESDLMKALKMAVESLGNDTDVGSKWIPCSERLPEEHDSMFKKFKGTNKWKSGMFESISNEVNVTIKFENGKTATTSGHTVEGRWTCEREYAFGTKVIAWQPLPEPYKEGET